MNDKFFDFIASPKKVLTCAAGVGVVMLVLALIYPIIYRDSVNYMAASNALWLHNWRTAFNLTIVPLLFIVSGLLQNLGLNACQGLSLVSSLLAIGMLFLGYRVLSFYIDKRLAAWGSVLYFIIPPVFMISFAPLTDSARWFSFLLCWWLILLCLQHLRWYKLILLGVAYAIFALIRSEGIVFVGLLSVWFFFEQWRAQGWREGLRRWYKFAAVTIVPLVVMVVLLMPRLVQLRRETGFYALDTRQVWAIKGALSHISSKGGDKLTADPLVTYKADDKFHYSYLRDGKMMERFWRNLFSGNYRAYTLFTLLGLLLTIRRRKWKYFHTLLCVFAAVNAFSYMLMRSMAGRYFYINTFLFMPFTLDGIIWAWELLKKLPGKVGIVVRMLMPYAVCTFLTVSILCGMKNIFSDEYDYYTAVGGFMKALPIAGGHTRSGTTHPVYLLLGPNYGWGFHCRGNELVYSNQFEMNKRYSVSDILTKGVPTEFCSFAVDPLKGVGVLKPDYVLVDDEEDADRLLADSMGMLEEIPQCASSRVCIYRVKP